MIITVFTGNHPRHTALIESLAAVAERVYAVVECSTLFPGKVADTFRRSEVMQRYFDRVIAAEDQVFGRSRFLPDNVRSLPLKAGDLNELGMDVFNDSLQADIFVIFGASYIKGPLVEHLVSRRACNIHMGISPYYRGSSCNFWALYDRRPDLVGATIHLLSKGLDSGPMLCHALPAAEAVDPFVLGMKAVRAAHAALVDLISSGEIADLEPVIQDRTSQIRYTRNADFTDAVAEEYLLNAPVPDEIHRALMVRDPSLFLRCRLF